MKKRVRKNFIQKETLNPDLENKKISLGWLGKLFGDKEHSSVNVGWAIIACSFIILLVLIIAIIYIHPY